MASKLCFNSPSINIHKNRSQRLQIKSKTPVKFLKKKDYWSSVVRLNKKLSTQRKRTAIYNLDQMIDTRTPSKKLTSLDMLIENQLQKSTKKNNADPYFINRKPTSRSAIREKSYGIDSIMSAKDTEWTKGESFKKTRGSSKLIVYVTQPQYLTEEDL